MHVQSWHAQSNRINAILTINRARCWPARHAEGRVVLRQGRLATTCRAGYEAPGGRRWTRESMATVRSLNSPEVQKSILRGLPRQPRLSRGSLSWLPSTMSSTSSLQAKWAFSPGQSMAVHVRGSMRLLPPELHSLLEDLPPWGSLSWLRSMR